MAWISLLFGALLLIFARWLVEKLRIWMYYDLYKLPCPSGELPILGHALKIPMGNKPNFHMFIMDKTLEFGKIWRLNLLGEDVVVVTEPEATASTVYGHGDNAEPKNPLYRPFRKLFWKTEGTNLFVAEHADERYKAYRKTIAVAFSSQNLKKKFPGLLKEAHSLAAAVDENIEGGKAVDFQCLGVRYSFNNIGHFAYDVDFDSFKTGHPLLSALSYCTDECMLDAVNPLHKLSKTIFPFSVAAKKEKSCFQSLYALYQELFDRADLYGDDPNDEDQSIRACLMRLRNPLKNNEKPPPDELMSEFTTLLVGGTDTTGHEIGWLMMWVASNREFQDKIYCEMKAEGLAGVGAREVEFSDLAKLTYLKMVIMEVLRKSPVASTILTRTIRKDTTVLGYRLPKGTTVGSCVQAQNNAPWLWKDSKEFHPERWAKGSKEGNNGESEVRGAKGFLTFGAGVRDCVGQRLAMLELQLVLAVLVSKFTFELDPRMGGMEGAMKLGYNSLVTICDGGAWVRARRRSMDETHD